MNKLTIIGNLTREPELRKLVFDLRKLPATYWGNYKMAFALVKLKDLNTLAL